MAPRRNAKQADVEPVEKVAETGDVSPPKRTKVVKPLSVSLEQLKDTRSMRSTKTRNAEETEEIIEPESEPIKKSRARNKVVPAKSTKLASQEQTTKSERNVKKGKAIEDISSSNDPNDPVIETNDSISQKIPAKKTRGKTVTIKAGTTDNIEAKAKPKTRAKKTETPKDTDTEVVSTKEKKKNVAEKVPKETKTKVKPLKKVVEKNDTIVVEAKKKTNAKAKTTENNISKVEKSTVNEEKKAKSQGTKKMRNQADNVPDAIENNVEETNNSKPVKGRQKKVNKDNAIITDTSKKGRGKKETVTAVVKNVEEKESENAELSSSEEEKESESVEVLSKTNNVQKLTNNIDNESPNSENEDSTELDTPGLNKNKIEDSISDGKDNASTSE